FSEALDPLTVTIATFTLKQAITLTPVSGTVTYAGVTATFTPASSLATSTVYTATMSTGVKDVAGNFLANPYVWSFTTGAAPLAAVDLGTAGNYVILAKTAVSTVPASVITGDVGVSPAATTFLTGFSLTKVGTLSATSPQVTGSLYGADMTTPTNSNLTTAVLNMQTAYTDAAGRPTPAFLNLGTGEIGGKTLTPGLYKWTTGVTISTDVTISGGPNDVWIFQIPGNLTVSPAKNVSLSGGAKAKNIFWQVAGFVDIQTNAHFEGIILCQTAIMLKTGASMNGRALAQTAVNLDQNTVTKPTP
ncbi:MAG: ice-binding family protein, partial [Chloroflexota bacterium]